MGGRGRTLSLLPPSLTAPGREGLTWGSWGVSGDHGQSCWLFRLARPGERWPLAVLGRLLSHLFSSRLPCRPPETRGHPGACRGGGPVPTYPSLRGSCPLGCSFPDCLAVVALAQMAPVCEKGSLAVRSPSRGSPRQCMWFVSQAPATSECPAQGHLLPLGTHVRRACFP